MSFEKFARGKSFSDYIGAEPPATEPETLAQVKAALVACALTLDRLLADHERLLNTLHGHLTEAAQAADAGLANN